MARVLAESAPENRNRMMIIAAVVFAALAAILLFVALQNRDSGGGSSASADTNVVVASQDISPNTVLTADMLEMKSVASNAALGGVYSDIESAVGLPVRNFIQQGEQVTSAKIGVTAIQDENDLAPTINPGMRAFAVEATEVTAVGGNLLAGNYVDVIVAFKDVGTGYKFTKTVLQNLRVLSVAQEALEPVPAAPTPAEGAASDGEGGVQGERPEDIERQPRARSVTLEVTPQQVQTLAILQAGDADLEVEIQLALRPVGDNDIPPDTITDFNEIFSPPLPTRTP